MAQTRRTRCWEGHWKRLRPGSIMIGLRLAQLRLLMFEPLWFDAYGDDPSRTWLLLYRLSKDWTSEFRERATREQFE